MTKERIEVSARSALELALEALKNLPGFLADVETAIMVAEEALANHIPDATKMVAQPEHSATHGEPVAWGWIDCGKLIGALDYKRHPDYITPLYTTPPTQCNCSQRQCNVKPLTDDQIYQMWTDEGLANSYDIYSLKEHVRRAARAIEAAHGIMSDTDGKE